MEIQEWFLYKKFNKEEREKILMADKEGGLKIVTSTVKAVLYQADSDLGQLKFWCPKSCLEVNKTKWKTRKKQMKKGSDYNRSLVRYGKEKGIKGIRKGLNTDTLIRKISEAGYEVPGRER